MRDTLPNNLAESTGSDPLRQRLVTVGTNLGTCLGAILDRLPGTPHRPIPLAKGLGVNRAVTSNLLKAISQDNPLEILHVIPGPEPLRKITARLKDGSVPKALLDAAAGAIDAFDLLINDQAGTRPALDALIAPYLPGARAKLELASRYAVFKGISQLKGVQGELWIGTAVITPSPTDPERLDLTWLNGASAIQRMRPGVDVRFSYRFPQKSSQPDVTELELGPGDDVTSLEQFCANPPARLLARSVGDAVHYHLPDDILGPKEKVDMFVVDHHPASMRRFAVPDADASAPQQTALFVEIAIPVANLVFDVILHEDVFPDAQAQLYFYDTGYNGVANVNDKSRDHERVDQVAPLKLLAKGMGAFETEHLPNYLPMLNHMAKRHGWDLAKFRGHRLNLQYPVFGWQVSMAFEKPPHPDTESH